MHPTYDETVSKPIISCDVMDLPLEEDMRIVGVLAEQDWVEIPSWNTDRLHLRTAHHFFCDLHAPSLRNLIQSLVEYTTNCRRQLKSLVDFVVRPTHEYNRERGEDIFLSHFRNAIDKTELVG